jgi:hypothetical protein
VAVQRATLSPELWYVYWGHREAHTVLGEECEPFASLAAANRLTWLPVDRQLDRQQPRVEITLHRSDWRGPLAPPGG